MSIPEWFKQALTPTPEEEKEIQAAIKKAEECGREENFAMRYNNNLVKKEIGKDG